MIGNMRKYSNLKLDVYCDAAIGDRKYMEDVILIATHDTDGSVDFLEKPSCVAPFACFFIFDGHGGVEAAKFARKNLLKQFLMQKEFYSDDDEQVLSAIKKGFLKTQDLMFEECFDWPKTDHGRTSTSGTTASMVMIRKKKMYVAHVGDSRVVLAQKCQENEYKWNSVVLTEDHKPDDSKELERIRKDGGDVINRAGVPRVVWRRKRLLKSIDGQEVYDMVPFLAVSRSLGDFWSYNPDLQVYTVSPEPDVSVHEFDPSKIGCIVLASDGLWNVMKTATALECVRLIRNDDGTHRANIATGLVNDTLASCMVRKLKADNTSVVVICPEMEESDNERPQDYFSVNITGNSFGKKTSVCIEKIHDEVFGLAESSSPTQKLALERTGRSVHSSLNRIVSVSFNGDASHSDLSKVFKSSLKDEESISEKIDFSKLDDLRSPPSDSEDILVRDFKSGRDAPISDDEVSISVDPSDEILESEDINNSLLRERIGENPTLNDFPSKSDDVSSSMENQHFTPSLFVDFNKTLEESKTPVRSLKRKSKSYSGSDSKRMSCASDGSKSYSEGCKGRALVETLQVCS